MAHPPGLEQLRLSGNPRMPQWGYPLVSEPLRVSGHQPMKQLVQPQEHPRLTLTSCWKVLVPLPVSQRSRQSVPPFPPGLDHLPVSLPSRPLGHPRTLQLAHPPGLALPPGSENPRMLLWAPLPG
jgi:hypothetical protein